MYRTFHYNIGAFFHYCFRIFIFIVEQTQQLVPSLVTRERKLKRARFEDMATKFDIEKFSNENDFKLRNIKMEVISI